jgi:hypothetical protein
VDFAKDAKSRYWHPWVFQVDFAKDAKSPGGTNSSCKVKCRGAQKWPHKTVPGAVLEKTSQVFANTYIAIITTAPIHKKGGAVLGAVLWKLGAVLSKTGRLGPPVISSAPAPVFWQILDADSSYLGIPDSQPA